MIKYQNHEFTGQQTSHYLLIPTKINDTTVDCGLLLVWFHDTGGKYFGLRTF